MRPPTRRRASSASSSSAAPATRSRGTTNATSGGTTSSTAEADECEPERDGGRGHALPPPHVGDDREAEGRPAHERRLPPPRRRHPQVDLRHPRRHDLVVRGRRRLGHRPQLHRLRAARERDDERPLRGRPRVPGLGPPLGDRRALQGQLVLHGADPHPLVREDGRRLPRAARPLVAPPARHRRRADQPGGLGLVLEGDRPGALPGRRHLVADGDRRHPHHAAPRPDHAQARLGDGAVPRDQARRSSTSRGTPFRRARAAS